MNFLDKLLTNQGAVVLNENEGMEYIFEGTHMGIGIDKIPKEEKFNLTLGYDKFHVQCSSFGYIMYIQVDSKSYKVGKIVGEIIHKWDAYLETDDLNRYGSPATIIGTLILNPRHKGLIWTFAPKGDDEGLHLITKRHYYKKQYLVLRGY